MFKIAKEMKKIKDSLISTIEKNDNAIDFIENELVHAEDMLKLYPENLSLVDTVSTLKFIKFQLEYLSEMYDNALKQYR